MKRVILAILVSITSCMAHAKSIVTQTFFDGEKVNVVALESVPNKALVIEFIDPLATGIGRDIARLWFLEIFASVSDQ